jgi:hypothetical protein
MEFDNKLKPKPVKKPKYVVPEGKMSVYEGEYLSDERAMAEFLGELKNKGISYEIDPRLSQGSKKPHNIIIDKNSWEDLRSIHGSFKSHLDIAREKKAEDKERRQKEWDANRLRILMKKPKSKSVDTAVNLFALRNQEPPRAEETPELKKIMFRYFEVMSDIIGKTNKPNLEVKDLKITPEVEALKQKFLKMGVTREQLQDLYAEWAEEDLN